MQTPLRMLDMECRTAVPPERVRRAEQRATIGPDIWWPFGCQEGETSSAVVLLEAALRTYEEVLGLRHPGVTALTRRAELLFETLEPQQREQVMAPTF